MSARRLRALAHLFQARLSRRIVLWVFASIVVIEVIVLIPSVYRREQELLLNLRNISAAKASGLADSYAEAPEPLLLERLTRMRTNAVVLGGTLYRNSGEQVGSFGEAPDLTFTDVTQGNQPDLLNRSSARYDAGWLMSPLDGQYLLIIRHDAIPVRQELFAFMGRIALLVLIISAFVTIATLIVLEPTLITPILTLRQDLLKAGKAVRDDHDPPEFKSFQFYRQDELGEVIAAFEEMFSQISEAIAERKAAEAALRLSEEKFSKAFQSSPISVTISTLKDGQFIEVNDSFLKLFGCSLEEAISHTALELGLWIDPAARVQMIETLNREGALRNCEYRFRTRSGEIRTALYSAERLTIAGQDCVLAVTYDITDRKQAEEALRESESRFRALVEQAVDAFFVVDLAGKIIDVNQRACQTLGYSPEELMSLKVSDIQQEVSDRQLSELLKGLAPGAPVTLEGVHQRKDGTTFPVEVRAGLFKFGGRQLVLALARDITERKQAEQALARLAEIGELAAMIVHEVRNPLTTVLMGLNSFKAMDLSERAQARLGLALEESNRLQRLLNEILLYAKQQVLQLVELDLNLFIAELLTALGEQPIAGDRPISFQAAPRPAPVKCDRDKLKQVLINLISNACEAIPAGEAVTCRVELLQQPQVLIQVQNGGAPIPAEILPQLTKPFYTTKSSGNGLGLAITKRIVEAHSGTLTIESSAETGTLVTVTLPLAIASSENAAETNVP